MAKRVYTDLTRKRVFSPVEYISDVQEIRNLLSEKDAYKIEKILEKYTGKKVVRNFMSGKDVVIDHDTPISCDPSSETYWSM